MSVDFGLQLFFNQQFFSSTNPDLIIVTAIVQRTGVLAGPQPVRLELVLSADNAWDSSDVVLVSRDLIFTPNTAGSGVNFTLDLRHSAISRGAFTILARVDSQNKIVETNESNNEGMLQGSAAGADAVLEWISASLSAVMTEGQQGRGVGPTVGTRMLAMLSTAIYDTVCGFNTTQTPYRFNFDAPTGASRDAAIIGAASRLLNQLLPGQADYFAARRSASLAKLGSLPGSALTAGLAFGEQMADRVIAARALDGSTNSAPYVPPTRLDGYVWKPQVSGPTAGVALGPHWGEVTPFAISNVEAFLPVGGLEARPDRNYAKYVAQLEEVRLYGGLTATAKSPVLRTADQTEMAKFWAYDRPDTYRPYGQINQIAVDLSLKSGGLTVEKNAALFAALNVALADAVIVAWEAKYNELQPRPSDLITGQVVDANGKAVAPVVDTAWRSLLSEINGVQSPPFPDYLSGHSSMGGVFSEVMTHYFGNNRTFDAYSQEMPYAVPRRGIKRTFNGFWDNGVFRNSFYQAGWEDALSRIYGGVHIREACEDSFFMGQQVGAFVAKQFFQTA